MSGNSNPPRNATGVDQNREDGESGLSHHFSHTTKFRGDGVPLCDLCIFPESRHPVRPDHNDTTTLRQQFKELFDRYDTARMCNTDAFADDAVRLCQEIAIDAALKALTEGRE